jgi:hypothetical protein
MIFCQSASITKTTQTLQSTTQKDGMKFTKRYISIYGFTGGDDYMNDEWEIVKSNKNVLIIVSDKQGGLIIREFTKKKR